MGQAATNQTRPSGVELSLTVQERILSSSWWKFTLFGALLSILGVIVLGTPLIGTVAVKTLLAAAFLVAGVLQVVHAFSSKAWNCFFWNLLSGVLYLGCGAAFFAFPVLGAVTLTLVLASLFLVEGIIEVFMAMQSRPLQGWGWLFFSGLVGIALSLLIFAGLPGSAVWAIGLMVGINLLASGFSMTMIGLALRQRT